MDFIQSVRKGYPEIYKESDGEGEGFDFGREGQFIAKWGGYTELIYIISSEFKKLPTEIYKMPALDFLDWTTYLIEKREVEAARLKKRD